MAGDDSSPPIPMGLVIANELELLGSHGMQAHQYNRMLDLIVAGQLHPERLISDHVSLEAAAILLPKMNDFPGNGVTVINQF